MTGSQVQLTVDEGWVDLPVRLDGDPGDWAAELVDRTLRERGTPEPNAVVQLYVQSWALLVERLRARRDGDAEHLGAAYALVSPDDLLPVAVAELWAVGTPMSLDAVVDAAVVDAGSRVGEPVVSEVTAPAGTGVRVQQYVVPSGSGAVQCSVAHVWPGPLEGTTVLLSTWFSSFVDAELYGPVLEQLASSLAWRP